MANYVTSTNIKVFPAGFRSGVTDDSKVTTERNLTELTILSKETTIRNRWITDPNNSDYDIIYLNGYRFRIAKENIPEDAEYASIKLRYVAGDSSTTVLCPWEYEDESSDITLDVSGEFKGIYFSEEKPPTSDANVYSVEKNSCLVLDATEIRNYSITEDKSISEKFDTEELKTNLINNLTIIDQADIDIPGIRISKDDENYIKATDVNSFNKASIVNSDVSNITINGNYIIFDRDSIDENTVKFTPGTTLDLPGNSEEDGSFINVQTKDEDEITNTWVEVSDNGGESNIVKRDSNGNVVASSFNDIEIKKLDTEGKEDDILIASVADNEYTGIRIAKDNQFIVTSDGDLTVDNNHDEEPEILIKSGIYAEVITNDNIIEGFKISNKNDETIQLPLNLISNDGDYVWIQNSEDNIQNKWNKVASNGNNVIVRTDDTGTINVNNSGTTANATNVTTKIADVNIDDILVKSSGSYTANVKRSINSFEVESVIAGRTITDIFLPNSPIVKEAAKVTNSLSFAASGTDISYDGSATKTIGYASVGAAPTNHAINDNTYGLGTAGLYGHVKLSSGDLSDSAIGTVVSGIAAASAHNHDSRYAMNNAIIISDGSSATSTGNMYITGAVQTGAQAGSSKQNLYNNSSVYFTKEGNFYCKEIYLTSDKRLKKNIIEFESKKSILELPIYKYDFIDGDKDQIGCLAQDLQEICPEIVKEDETGFLHIEESKIVYLLLDEVKKLKKEVEKLKENK